MFNIREAEPQDLNFITNSWLRRYRDAVHPRLISDAQYYEAQHRVIAAILQSENCRVWCAVDVDDPDHIYAYVVSEDLTPEWSMVHWVYTKGNFRRFGLAKALLKKAIGECTRVSYSHRTNLVTHLDKNKSGAFTPQFVWAIL